MAPELKFHSYVTSFVTFSVFSIWTYTADFVSEYPEIAVVVASVFTLGMYKVIATGCLEIFRRSRTFKKHILGPQYMEGTWVGYFVGHDKSVRYLVEVFEQDLSTLKVRGKVFREDYSFHSSHESNNASIDLHNGKLSYTYQSDAISNTHINPGLANFSFGRDNRDKPPSRLVGYSSDIFHPDKLPAFEEKISDLGDLELYHSLQGAIKVYDKYRNVSKGKN